MIAAFDAEDDTGSIARVGEEVVVEEVEGVCGGSAVVEALRCTIAQYQFWGGGGVLMGSNEPLGIAKRVGDARKNQR